MLPTYKRLFFLLLATLFFFAPSLQAEDQVISPPQGWWLKSSLDPSARYDGLLHKVDFSLSYTALTGNISGHVMNISPALTLRQSRWTFLLSDDYSRKKYTQGEDRISSRYRTTMLEGQFDFSRYIYAGGGVIWEKDTNNNIELRRVTLAGLGSYLLASDRLNLGVFLGGGETDEEYDAVVERFTAMDHRTFNILYFYQSLNWQLTEWLLLNQGIRVIHSFSEMNEFELQDATGSAVVAGAKKRSLIKGKAELQAPLRKNLNLFTSYQLNYDSHAWPGNKTTDTVTMVGIRFSH